MNLPQTFPFSPEVPLGPHWTSLRRSSGSPPPPSPQLSSPFPISQSCWRGTCLTSCYLQNTPPARWRQREYRGGLFDFNTECKCSKTGIYCAGLSQPRPRGQLDQTRWVCKTHYILFDHHVFLASTSEKKSKLRQVSLRHIPTVKCRHTPLAASDPAPFRWERKWSEKEEVEEEKWRWLEIKKWKDSSLLTPWTQEKAFTVTTGYKVKEQRSVQRKSLKASSGTNLLFDFQTINAQLFLHLKTKRGGEIQGKNVHI